MNSDQMPDHTNALHSEIESLYRAVDIRDRAVRILIEQKIVSARVYEGAMILAERLIVYGPTDSEGG